MPSDPIKLAVLPGDGIGAEVTDAAIPVLNELDLPIELTFGDIGWSCWQKEGKTIPDKTWALIKRSDVVLLGATTSKPAREALDALPAALRDNPPSYLSPIIELRQTLNLYANVRPCFDIKGDGKAFDFCVIRENTEGLYSGFDYYPLPQALMDVVNASERWQAAKSHELACSLRLQSRAGLCRLFEYAFKYADDKKMKRVTFADKPNVLRNSSAFARALFESVATCYPHIEADILNVDAVGLWLVRRPQRFGVIVAENMFGDILSDVGAAVMGGLGFAPSANRGEKMSYFEPVHGSGPNMKPQSANPCAMFLTIAMLLEALGYAEKARRIQDAIRVVIHNKTFMTYDLGGNSTTKSMADAIINRVVKTDV